MVAESQKIITPEQKVNDLIEGVFEDSLAKQYTSDGRLVVINHDHNPCSEYDNYMIMTYWVTIFEKDGSYQRKEFSYRGSIQDLPEPYTSLESIPKDHIFEVAEADSVANSFSGFPNNGKQECGR